MIKIFLNVHIFLKLILKCHVTFFYYLLQLTFFFSSLLILRSLFINEPYILAIVIMMLNLANATN